jgi:transposase
LLAKRNRETDVATAGETRILRSRRAVSAILFSNTVRGGTSWLIWAPVRTRDIKRDSPTKDCIAEVREVVRQQGARANIPPKLNRKDPICFSPYLYRERKLIERFFNKIKRCRRVATRYDKLAANYRGFIELASSEFGCALMSPRARPPRFS